MEVGGEFWEGELGGRRGLMGRKVNFERGRKERMGGERKETDVLRRRGDAGVVGSEPDGHELDF